jgi:methionine synthase II (cobalamin-independent)
MLGARAGAYSFEAANPRHEHEWRVWQNVKLLIPGIITRASSLVDHPEAAAQPIGRFAAIVGRENVIDGADCGFVSFPPRARFTRASSGPSSGHWPKAHASRPENCGEEPRGAATMRTMTGLG